MNLFVKTPKFVSKIIRQLIWNIPKAEKKIYLSFDDGPIPNNTEWILKTLNKYNAKATFFCVGQNVQKYPFLYEKIIENGHAVGNHTFNHLNAWKNSKESYLQNIEMAAQHIKSNLFRPPYGKLKFNLYREIKKNYKIVMWDVLSRDFDNKITPEQCYTNVIKNVKHGSVVVFHDNYKARENLEYALPRVLEYYNNLGCSFEVIKTENKQKS